MRTEGVSLRRRSCFRKEPRSPQGVDSTAAPRARGCLRSVLDRLRLNRPGTLSAGRRLNAKIMSTDVQRVAEAGRILIAKSGCLMFPMRWGKQRRTTMQTTLAVEDIKLTLPELLDSLSPGDEVILT